MFQTNLTHATLNAFPARITVAFEWVHAITAATMDARIARTLVEVWEQRQSDITIKPYDISKHKRLEMRLQIFFHSILGLSIIPNFSVDTKEIVVDKIMSWYQNNISYTVNHMSGAYSHIFCRHVHFSFMTRITMGCMRFNHVRSETTKYVYIMILTKPFTRPWINHWKNFHPQRECSIPLVVRDQISIVHRMYQIGGKVRKGS